MELRVDEVQLPQEIRFNYSELKQELEEKVSVYSNMVYSDDQIKNAKADRADLNRLKKALNDERIRREKEYMKPFNAFNSQINEIIGIIDKPVALIDKQIKEYEKQQKHEKKRKIEKHFDSIVHPDWLTLSMIWNEKWLNTSVSMSSILGELDTKFETIKSDLATLSDLPEFSFEAIETYKATLDLNKSIAEGHRLSEMQKRKAEQERIKAEQEKARAEHERLQKEQEAEKQERLRREYEEEQRRQEERMSVHPNYHIPAVKPDPEMREWVSFKAFVTVDDANALKEFFESRNIEFSRI